MIKTKIKKTEKEKCRMRARNLLFTALSILLFCGTYSTLKAQAIPQYFWGTNAWMPDSVGNDDSPQLSVVSPTTLLLTRPLAYFVAFNPPDYLTFSD